MRGRFRHGLPCLCRENMGWVVRMTDLAVVSPHWLRTCLLAALGPLVGMGTLDATPVGVGDPSFEGNALAAGGYSYDLDPEWQETGGAGSTSGFEEYITGFNADGTDHLGMETGHDVWQDLGSTYQANTRYTLTVAVGNRSGSTQSGNLSFYSLADSTGALYVNAATNASTVAASTFADAPDLVFDTTANPAAVGKTIRILLQARGAGRSHFDHIRLDAEQLQQPGAASLVLHPAIGLSANAATLRAQITDIGVGAPSMTFYYGTTDGGIDPAGWDLSEVLAGTHSGLVTAPVSGLLPATNYYFSARATNAAGDSWATPSQSFETLALPPTVINLPAQAITTTAAEVGAEVTDNGGDNPQVTIYYGTTDGVMNSGAWEASVSLGSVSGQAFGALAGLVPGTTYHYRAYAVNSGGGVWAASSATFATTPVTLAEVRNRTPNGITGTTASLRGEVEEIGGDVPVVTVYYGQVDGGTTPGAWAESVALGLQDGNFSVFVADLLPNTTYWFRCSAQNAAGTAWAGNSDFFTTTGLVPSGVVINEIHYDPPDESTPGEFIELHNPGDSTADLAGWMLTDGVEFTFPAGTTVAPGAYLVVAEDPATALSLYGVTALGPWVGRLNNDGEQIDLRDDGGVVQDQVTFGAGFPWPTSARGGGASAELVHPSLDNELGGSWRSSSQSQGQSAVILIPAADASWRYRKGTSEASSPINEWRLPSFSEDGTWSTGQTPVGYGDGDDNTVLSDMQNNYTTVYLRREFTLSPGELPDSLTLRVYADDGAVVWINGTEVARPHVNAGEIAYDGVANNHEAAWEEFTISNASLFLIGGTNVLAVHGLNTRTGSSDFSIDAELIIPEVVAGSADPSPGERNQAYSIVAPPQIRQVDHSPNSPVSGDPVTITAKITDPDGVGPVSLEYQLVDPGSYVRKTDAGYGTGWTSVPMVDDGSGNDFVGGDFIFTAELPGPLQVHRRLVRYRIIFEDGNGLQATVPWGDDEQPNFAYFTYDGAPAWSGSFTGGAATDTFPFTLMDDIATYHLLANTTDVINSQYSGGSDGAHMFGTLVYDGKVYDHIEFENRGEASTYVSGKNKWRFHFTRARAFGARDNLGKRYTSDWNEMNFEGCSSPWAAVHRGMAGVEEALSYRLYELCGVPSPRTHYVHFRVVDDAVETDPTDQYEGDLWGLYLALEQPDGSFLNDRGLPDGNVYKIEGGNGDKKEQGLGQPTDSSDWNAFYAATNSTQTESWWRSNVDMDTYYSFRSCNRISGNVDLRGGYNHYFYHHPSDYWVPMPWDLDMMFIAETHWPGFIRTQNSLNHAALAVEFRNRARELLDLMCSDNSTGGGQIGQLIDEYAQIVNPPGLPLTFADLDAFMWNYHPRTKGNPSTHSGQTNHKGNFHYTPYGDSRIGGSWTRTLVSSNHEGSMRYLTDYATDTYAGGSWAPGNGNQYGYGYEFLKQESNDTQIPTRPTVTFSGTPGFPVNDLRFTSSAFSDPQGAGSFSAMRWRIAEIAAPGVTGHTTGDPRKYEVGADWDSGELTSFGATIQIPVAVARAGHTYRARVRHKDSSGRWSHWSQPVEFVATAADVTLWQDNLVISEFMYHPPEPVGVGETSVSTDKDDYEFIELWNASPGLTLDLTDLRFTKGVDFDFAGSAVTSLAPAERVLVVKHIAAFEARYGTGLPVAGVFTGNLSNGGEQLKLSFGAGTAIRDFVYDDVHTVSDPWPEAADGDGPSLVLIDPETIPDHTDAANWMASGVAGGTPGSDEPPAPGSYEEFQVQFFTPAELLNPAISGAEADPDGDGRPNLLEWALATCPLEVDSPVWSFAWVEDGGLVYPGIRFQKPEVAVGLVYELQACSDLGSWVGVGTVPVSEGSLGGGIEQAVMRDILTESEPRRFLRLGVALSP